MTTEVARHTTHPMEQQSPNAVTLTTSKQSDVMKSVMILLIYLSTKDELEREHLVYALLDTQSDTTFSLGETSEKLNAQYELARLKLSTGLPLVREKSGKFKVREKSGNVVLAQRYLRF